MNTEYRPTDLYQPASTHLTYRPDIDGLRAIAVVAVIIFHAFPSLLPSGFIGVDMFFVISGYLITSIILKGLNQQVFSFKTFYRNRIKRIFPALATVLILTIIAGWMILPADEYKQLGKHIASSAGFISNFTLWEESGYFDTAADTKPLLHLWSLGIEEQFYIIWPLILWFSWKKRLNYLWPLLLLAVLSFAANIHIAHTDPTDAKLYYAPNTRFWELWIGALLAYISLFRISLTRLFGNSPAHTSPKTLLTANVTTTLGVALLLTGFMTISTDRIFPGWWALLPTIGSALIISAGMQAWFNRIILANRWFVCIGLISFPLYLWHWPLLSFVHIVDSATPAVATRIALVASAFVLGWLTKKWIEDPLRFGLTKKAVTPALIFVLLLTGLAGYVIYAKQGIPARHGITELKRDIGRYECDDRKKNSGCVFGNLNSDKLIILFGDSHAEHLSKALDTTFGHDYKIHMITNGSCFVGNTFTIPEIGNKKDCSKAISTLKSVLDKPVYAIIRSQRWHGYGIEDRIRIERAVNDTITMFTNPPGKIVIVGSTADVDFNCLVNNYYAPSDTKRKSCNTFENIKRINQVFIDTTSQLDVPANVHFVYPYRTICPNGLCTPIQGNIALYSDIHHLSKDGAMLIMPDIAKLLTPPDK